MRALAFAAMFFLNLPFPLLIAAAALWGYLTTRGAAPVGGVALPARTALTTAKTVAIWAALWAAPVAALGC